QRDSAGLPFRLSDLLFQRADRRLGGAGLPPAQRAEPFRALPASPERGEWLGAVSRKTELDNRTGGTGEHGTGLPPLFSTDGAAAGGNAPATGLRHGLSNLLPGGAPGRRSDHRVPAR